MAALAGGFDDQPGVLSAEVAAPTQPRPPADGGHRLRPFPALDGVRGLAVAAVVLFHFPTHTWVRGGLFGVDAFFVLSGFLVTAGLLDEVFDTGGIRIRAFLARRARRLVPALVAFLLVFLGVAAFFRSSQWFASNPFGSNVGRPVPMHRALDGAAAALAYSYNVLLVHAKVTPLPLGHLWTLAIEGQFYVGWVLALRWITRRSANALLPITVTLAAVSACEPWFLWHGGSGANAIYFGTLPRLQQLLLGAVVAQVWRQGWFDKIPLQALRVAAIVGAVTLATMCFAVGNVTFKYLGSESVTAVATAAVVAFLISCPSASPGSRAVGIAPLAWLGRRSYGVYLWHWPMAAWTNRIPHDFGVPLGIGLSLVLAEASWRVVERPAQRWRSAKRNLRERHLPEANLPKRNLREPDLPAPHLRGAPTPSGIVGVQPEGLVVGEPSQ